MKVTAAVSAIPAKRLLISREGDQPPQSFGVAIYARQSPADAFAPSGHQRGQSAASALLATDDSAAPLFDLKALAPFKTLARAIARQLAGEAAGLAVDGVWIVLNGVQLAQDVRSGGDRIDCGLRAVSLAADVAGLSGKMGVVDLAIVDPHNVVGNLGYVARIGGKLYAGVPAAELVQRELQSHAVAGSDTGQIVKASSDLLIDYLNRNVTTPHQLVLSQPGTATLLTPSMPERRA
jgi:hypothetical protein